MDLSHEKNICSLQSQQRSNYFSINNLVHSKANVLPPKMHRVASVSSNLYSYDSVPTNPSQQSKPSRNFSKDKSYFQLLPKTVNDSFNISGTKNSSSKDFFHRYSCNLDLEKNNDFLQNNEKALGSRDESNLQMRVRELQQKMRKNEQNFKYYIEEIDHFKLQLSSSSLNLLDSINTNTLTNSIKDPLKQIPSIQIFNNKQNFSKNILSFQSLANSPRDVQIEKKTKQIELIKNQIKKITSKEQNLKTHVKLFHDSMKDMLKSFKDHLEKSLQNLIRRQDKNKKKIFEYVNDTISQKIKEIQALNSQNLKQAFQNWEDQQKSKDCCKKIKVGKERFIGDTLLIKVREEVFAQMIKRPQLDEFSSYVEIIKKSLNNNASSEQIVESNLQKSDMGLIEKVVVQQAETTYFLDLQGYLLDSQGYYLMNLDKKIQLKPNQLQILKQHKILQCLP